MKVKRMSQTPAEVAENENLKATVERQNQIIENQKVTIQYLAAMTDVYIPEEEEEEDVQNFAENEEMYNYEDWLKMVEQAKERGKLTEEEYQELTTEGTE